ncbi:unnamed protein product, partial [Brenthis ino]
MPLLNKIPKLERCCGCVTDLKVAAAIIAVLGIVTSPIISWVIVRHAYVIRVTCVVTTNISRPDVIDINLHNALSFGFGANAGLGPSCLSITSGNDAAGSRSKSNFVQFVRFSGWVVLLADIAFLISSVNFLIKIFKGLDKQASLVFIGTGLLSIILSFMYGVLYVSACMHVGGRFPVFEFFFAMIDLIS